MNTEKYIKLHNRCIELLEGIDRCSYFIADAKASLSNCLPSNRPVYKRQYYKYKAIKGRLSIWYAERSAQLAQAGVMRAIQSNAFPICDIEVKQPMNMAQFAEHLLNNFPVIN